MSYKRKSSLWVAMLLGGSAGLHAQQSAQTTTAIVHGRVEVMDAAGKSRKRHGAIPGTVVWLTPVTSAEAGGDAVLAATSPSGSAPVAPEQIPQMVQRNKSFQPRILVVPAGSMVEFPNRDPFFHNVFSLFEGKRFDLGLYEAGTSRTVRFDRAGISYIFCNIHPEMNAVVITIATPLYAISTPDGQLNLAGVPYGRYRLHVWSEGMGPENVQPPVREITIAANSSSLGVIRVPEVSGQSLAHKNKYGREYDEPTPKNSVYEQH